MGWTRDAANDSLIAPLAPRLQSATKAIAEGRIAVADYEQTAACALAP
jgi:hypothetical protein